MVEDDLSVLDPGTEEIQCETCPAYDAQFGRCYGLAFYEQKPGPWYSGPEAIERCPRRIGNGAES